MAIVYTQQDLDRLKKALTSGASEVQIGDRRVKFLSKNELIELINTIEKSINGGDAMTDNTDVIVGGFSKKERC